jgi:hypothetical protein
VFVKTYGSVNITLGQSVGALDTLLGQLPVLGPVIDGLLQGLGLPILGPSGLAGLLTNQQLDVPLQLPNGQVGGSRQHTGVCS